ncbi:unnamed protein product [Sphagnum troendelagicum]|uniref:Uncharacterized protein n=1 Tax=Sphagnum troendelagicum TaxID=128251 RepID=A0ABP0UC92_9BRYO
MPDKGGPQDEHVKDTAALSYPCGHSILTRLQHLCPHPHQWRVMAACHCHAWSRCPMNKVKPICWKMHHRVACRTI